MIILANFLEPIEAANKPLDKNCKAYRMDGTSPRNMRETVGLGSCNCCDYFTSKDNIVILIEETQLTKMIKRLKNEYGYIKSSDQKEFVNNYILQENKLKVYGSMLVLCRLCAVCNYAKFLLKNKKYDFWLVASGPYKKGDSRVFSNLENRLSGSLKGSLGKMINAVKVIPASKLVAKLSSSVSTP